MSVQYISDWKIVIRHIAMDTTRRSMTGMAICEEIDRILGEIGAPQRNVYSTTTDNGANVLSAARKFLDKIDLDLTQAGAEPEAEAEEVPTEDARTSGSEGDNESEEDVIVSEFPNDGEDEEDVEEESWNDKPQDEMETDNYEELCVELQENVEAPSGTIGMGMLNDIRCAAHVVQLGVNDFLKKYRAEIELVKGAVKKIRTQFEHFERKDRPAKPTLANATRWSSTYKMVSRLLHS